MANLLNTQLKRGDLLLVGGIGWLSDTIRKRSTDKNEQLSTYSHVAVVVKDGELLSARFVEAIHPRVAIRSLITGYSNANPDTLFAVYRPKTLNPTAIDILVKGAYSYVGRRYAWGKIALHAIDSVLFGGRRVAKRLGLSRMPICSGLASRVWSLLALNFGVKSDSAQPDDIADYANAHPDQYELVMGPVKHSHIFN